MILLSVAIFLRLYYLCFCKQKLPNSHRLFSFLFQMPQKGFPLQSGLGFMLKIVFFLFLVIGLRASWLLR